MTAHLAFGTLLAAGWWAAAFWLSGRMLFSILRLPADARRTEWLVLLGVALGAACALRPFFYSGMIGAGDSYHYALQLADFVTQFRHGVLPVLVGQSEYAFNGNVHTVRTAPYFTLAGGVLDLVTLHQFSWFALKNCLVLLTAWAAAFSAYVVVRVTAPTCRTAALLLSFVYVSAPGVLGPLVALDLDATYMGSPWLLIFGGAIAFCLERRVLARPLLVSTVALAALWYAHPPTAAWVSPVFAAVIFIRLIAIGRRGHEWISAGFAAGGFALLTAFLFRSVATLQLPYTLGNPEEIRAAIISGLKTAAKFSFASFDDVNPATFLQLGWGLTGVLLMGLLPSRRMRAPQIFFALGAVVIGGFLFPLGRVTAAFWHLVPARLLDVTNVWPAQRFYPMLSALAVILAAWRLRGWSEAGARLRATSTAIFAGLAVLAGCQLFGIQRHAALLKIKPAESVEMLAPENLTLSRSSYLLFNFQPDNYSEGWVDPQFSSRLLDQEMSVRVTNEEAVLAASAEALATTPWRQLTPVARFDLDRTQSWLLQFRFEEPEAKGEVALRGAVTRAYSLPLSGGTHAFGSSEGASKILTIRADSTGAALLEISSTVPGVAVRAVPYSPRALPVAVAGLMPYHAGVNSRAPGFLETPQVWIPGYAATVNGHPQPVRRSLDGLVAIPIAAGTSEVVVSYPGPRGLKFLWWLSLSAFLSAPLLYRRLPRSDGASIWDTEFVRENHLVTSRKTFFSRRVAVIALTVFSATVVACGIAWLRADRESQKNSVRIEFELPRWAGVRSEPLLLTGRAGRADCVYLRYEDAAHVRIGYDHWGSGGAISPLLPASRGEPHTVEITLNALDARQADGVAILRVVYDGKEVLQQTAPFWSARAAEVYLGENPIGMSTAERNFSGRILSTERFSRDAP